MAEPHEEGIVTERQPYPNRNNKMMEVQPTQPTPPRQLYPRDRPDQTDEPDLPDISAAIPAQNLIAVEYPGYVLNVDKVLKTLDGEEGVAKAASSRANFLQLRFRPDDPDSHPLFGDQYHTNNLLLKITRRRKKKRQAKQQHELARSIPMPSSIRTSSSIQTSSLGKEVPAEVQRPPRGAHLPCAGSAFVLTSASASSSLGKRLVEGGKAMETCAGEALTWSSGVSSDGAGAAAAPAGSSGGGASAVLTDSAYGQLGSQHLPLCLGPDPNASVDGGIGRKREGVEDRSSNEADSIADMDDDDDGGKITIEVIAKVEATYRFDGLADFQYVPALHARSDQRRKRGSTSGEGKEGKDDLRNLDEDEQMSLIPPLFTKADMPQDYIRKVRGLDVAAKNQKKKVLSAPPEAVKAAGVICGLDFRTGVIPMKEDPRYVGNILGRKAVMECLDSLKDMFRRRPVWSRAMLNECFPEEKHMIVKRLLLRVSYYFGNGPWRMLWIRVGYDPRKEPLSRIYQLLDLRLPPDWVEAGREAAERNQKRASNPTQASKENPDRNQVQQQGVSSNASDPPGSAADTSDPSAATFAAPIYRSTRGDTDGLYPRWHDVCALRTLPQSRFVFLQLCDISDSTIQSAIKQKPQRKTCDEHTGWFSRETLDNFRRIVRSRFQKLLPDDLGEKTKTHREWERQQGSLMNQLAPEYYKKGLHKKGLKRGKGVAIGASRRGGGGGGGAAAGGSKPTGSSQSKTVIDSLDLHEQQVQRNQQAMMMHPEQGTGGGAIGGLNMWGATVAGGDPRLALVHHALNQGGNPGAGSLGMDHSRLSTVSVEDCQGGGANEKVKERQACGVTGGREEEDTRRELEGEGEGEGEDECLGVGEGVGAERDELEQMRKEMEMAAAEEEDEIDDDEDEDEEDEDEEDEEEDNEEPEEAADPLSTNLGENALTEGLRDAQDVIPANILEVLMNQFPVQEGNRSAFDKTTAGAVQDAEGLDDDMYQIYGDNDKEDRDDDGNEDEDDRHGTGRGKR